MRKPRWTWALLVFLWSNLAGLSYLSGNVAAEALAPPISGYASAQSVPQGGTINLHISTTVSSYDLVFFRYGAKLEQVGRVNGLRGAYYSCTNSHLGCSWPIAYTLTVPREWPSGLYLVRLLTPGEDLNYTWGEWIWFIVRAAQPGSTSSVLLVLSDNTWQAYNARNGLSFYTTPVRANYLSFDRPYGGPTGPEYAPSPAYLELPAIRWLESNNYVVEYASNYDLHAIPNLLSHYRIYMDVGHDEYWSWPMRDQVENFIAAGGNAIFFSSNTSYWQVRYENNGRTLVGFKNEYSADPILHDGDPTNDHLVTHLWCGTVVNRCEAAMTGITYVNGGRAKARPSCPYCNSGFLAQRVWHWAYSGVEIYTNQEYGATDTYDGVTGIAADEVDGALYEWGVDPAGPSVSPAGLAQGTPASFVILALAAATRDAGGTGWATMGVYTNAAGATVFSSSSWDWVNVGLMAGNSVVVQVTQNVFNRMAWSPTCVAPVVSITRSGNDSKLSWVPRAANNAYEVHRATTPYFVPSIATLQATLTPPSGTTYLPPYSYTDPGTTGNPNINYAWIVRARCGAGQADSRPVAEFDFPLHTGSPQP